MKFAKRLTKIGILLIIIAIICIYNIQNSIMLNTLSKEYKNVEHIAFSTSYLCINNKGDIILHRLFPGVRTTIFYNRDIEECIKRNFTTEDIKGN